MSCRNRRSRCGSRRRREADRDCFRRDERRCDRDERDFDELGFSDDFSGENRSRREDRECERREEREERRCDRDRDDRREDRDERRCDREERREERRCDRDRDRDDRRRERNSDRSYIVGNSVDICVRECDTEIKAKVVVQERDTVRVWGQVVDCQNRGVPFALVKLLKEGCRGLESISHSITDCDGFYQFEVCPERDGREFTILVSKDARSRERVESRGLRDNNCRGICRRDRSNGCPGDCGGFVR